MLKRGALEGRCNAFLPPLARFWECLLRVRKQLHLRRLSVTDAR